MNAIRYDHLESPIGRILLVEERGGLAGIFLEDHRRGRTPGLAWIRDERALAPVRRELAEYFAGRRTRFTLALAPAGGTAFQRAVRAELAKIPFGETISYAELACRAGRPGAARAAGAANARNPLSIVVPCHRVVASDGSLAGYAGGVARKRWLLEHERGRGFRGGLCIAAGEVLFNRAP